jgi:hypothetical protein
MAYTQADLDALKSLVARGTRSVTFSDGRSVVYRTMDEIERAIGMVQGEVNAGAGTPRVQRRRFTTCKGL